MVVGALGMVWIIVWFVSSRGSDFVVARTGVTKSQSTSEWWREIGRDRRFWALVVMVIAINIIWHIAPVRG